MKKAMITKSHVAKRGNQYKGQSHEVDAHEDSLIDRRRAKVFMDSSQGVRSSLQISNRLDYRIKFRGMHPAFALNRKLINILSVIELVAMLVWAGCGAVLSALPSISGVIPSRKIITWTVPMKAASIPICCRYSLLFLWDHCIGLIHQIAAAMHSEPSCLRPSQ